MRQSLSPRADPNPEPTLREAVVLVALSVGAIVFVSYPALVTAALVGAVAAFLTKRVRCRLTSVGATLPPGSGTAERRRPDPRARHP